MDEPATDGGGDETLAGTHAATRGMRALPDAARGTEIGRYLLVHEIGRGATGVVWAAYDGDLDRRVAIKLVAEAIDDDPERRKRLLGEAQAMAKIRHPNVVFVHDVGTWRGHLYIAMEFVEGTTLRRWCGDTTRSIADILDVFGLAARGLAAAHAAGLVHRDFKPDNVLIDERVAGEGRVRVADFGLAQAIDPTVSDAIARNSVGTPAYMSPEHHGGGVLDARSDQFSFCVALFEALAGARPFRGESLAELAAATLDGAIDPTLAARLPTRIRRVVLTGLAVDPAQRHASMDALIAALELARRGRRALVVGVAAVLAIGGIAWAMRPREQVHDPCARGAAMVREVWNDDARARIQLAYGAAAPKYGDRVREQLLATLDDYGRAWAELSDEVCRSGLGRARGEDPLADQRAACVDDRLAAFRGLVVLAGARTLEVHRVDALLGTLPELEECRRDDAAMWLPVPADTEVAARVAELRARLRDARLEYDVTPLAEVATKISAITTEARATGFPHVVAKSLSMLALVENDLGHPEQAERLIDEGLAIAIAAGHDRLAAEMAIDHIRLAGSNPSFDRDIDHWAALARALFDRAGADELARGELASALGGVYFNRGDFEHALEQHEISAKAFHATYGAGHHLTAAAEIDCATILASVGRTDEALARATAAVATIEAKLGREHNQAQRALHLLALVEDANGHTDAAIEHILDALDRAIALYGPHSREVSNISYNLVYMLGSRGRVVEAREQLVRSRVAWPVVGDAYSEAQFSEAESWLDELDSKPEEALQHLDAAIRMYPPENPASARPLANARLARAAILVELGRPREAFEIYATEYEKLGAREFLLVWMIDAMFAADAIGDHTSVLLWLARMESRHYVDLDEVIRSIGRAVAAGPAAARSEAVRRGRERLVEWRFAGHPLVRHVDAWIARATTSAPP